MPLTLEQQIATQNYQAGRIHQMRLVQDQMRIHLRELASAKNAVTSLEVVQQKIVQQFLDAVDALDKELR